MGVVILKGEILVFKIENGFNLGIDYHTWQSSWLPAKLKFNLLKMVKVDMGIAKGVDKFSGLQACGLRHHHGEQCVRSNVERNAKKNVGAALIELAREFSVGHVELEQGMAWGECHFLNIAHVPCANHMPARVGIGCKRCHHIRYLVDMPPVGGWPAAPLVSIYGAQIPICIGPFIPNGNPILIQVPDVAIAFQKPQQFVDDGFKMQFFGGEQGKSFVKIETHLIPKNAYGARTRPVALLHSVG